MNLDKFFCTLIVKDLEIITKEIAIFLNKNFLRGLEYLSGIVLLTKCDALIGGLASGLAAAVIWRGGFPVSHIWDLGIY